MKHSISPIRYAAAFARSLSTQLGLHAGAFFLLLSGACFGSSAPSGYMHSRSETPSVQICHTTTPDNTTRLPCTDQFVSDLAEVNWCAGLEAETVWGSAFAVALPVFTAYKRYKDCLKTAYPGAENTPGEF